MLFLFWFFDYKHKTLDKIITMILFYKFSMKTTNIGVEYVFGIRDV